MGSVALTQDALERKAAGLLLESRRSINAAYTTFCLLFCLLSINSLSEQKWLESLCPEYKCKVCNERLHAVFSLFETFAGKLEGKESD